MAGLRPQLWAGRGADLLGPVTYLDADGTITPTTGQYKAGMDIAYKGIRGYAPLIVSWANTREVPYLVSTPGLQPAGQHALERAHRTHAVRQVDQRVAVRLRGRHAGQRAQRRLDAEL